MKTKYCGFQSKKMLKNYIEINQRNLTPKEKREAMKWLNKNYPGLLTKTGKVSKKFLKERSLKGLFKAK